MDKIKLSIMICMIMMFLCSISSAQTGSTAHFLKIGIGSRASGMGEAFSGVLGDPASIYWNVAGIDKVNSPQIMAMYNTWLMDMSLQNLSAVLPLGSEGISAQGEQEIISKHYGTIGASISYSSSGKITKTDEDFNDLGDITAYDLVGTIAYANNLNDDIFYGAALKMVRQGLDVYSSTAFALDIGLICKQPFITGLTVGLAIRNLGTNTKFINESEPLPLNFRLGLAYNPGSFTIAADINKFRDGDLNFNFGGEYIIAEYIALRTGYNSANSFSMGLEVVYDNYLFGYAYIPNKDFNVSHRIEVRFSF